jgi:ribosomal protein S18 acetylase RimI-like enzyme
MIANARSDEESDQRLVETVVSAYRDGFWTRPDSQVIRREGWLEIVTPSSKMGTLNCVRHSVLPAREADSFIDSVVRRHASSSSCCRWLISPLSRPDDLAERLRQKQFKLLCRLEGMVRDTSTCLESSNSVQVRRISESSVEDYVDAATKAWAEPNMSSQDLRSDILWELSQNPETLHYFVAYLDGTPAGAAAVRLLPGSGYLLGAGVAPPFRRKGVYRALVAARLNFLQHREVPLASVVAIEETSAPVCRHLGFQKVCSMALYEISFG